MRIQFYFLLVTAFLTVSCIPLSSKSKTQHHNISKALLDCRVSKIVKAEYFQDALVASIRVTESANNFHVSLGALSYDSKTSEINQIPDEFGLHIEVRSLKKGLDGQPSEITTIEVDKKSMVGHVRGYRDEKNFDIVAELNCN